MINMFVKLAGLFIVFLILWLEFDLSLMLYRKLKELIIKVFKPKKSPVEMVEIKKDVVDIVNPALAEKLDHKKKRKK